MNRLKNTISSQFLIFALSLLIFIMAAAFGWEKLRYGFNFVDEGYHMTEAWRLTVGDYFFRDKITGAINLSPLINSIIFRISPDMTLLGFRRLQYVLTIFSLLLFSMGLYGINKQYWYQPLIFLVFAVTGSEPIGVFPDLNYYTYAHLFVTLHLSFLLIGFHLESMAVRRFLFAMSGFFLFLISFNLLHTSLVLISPLLYFYLLRKLKIPHLHFEVKDLFFVFIPVLLCWILFIGVFNVAYWNNIIASLQLLFSSDTYSPGNIFYAHSRFFECIAVCIIFLAAFLYCLFRLNILFLIPAIFALSSAMYFIIDTSFFGLLSPHFFCDYYSRPLWFSALISSVFVIFFFYISGKIIRHRSVSKTEALAALLFIPGMLLSISMSVFSNIGACNVVYSSIPVIGGISILILCSEKVEAKSYLVKFFILLIFFAPFYYSTAWSDWRDTGYDVPPEQANVEIDKGVGKGIRTNVVYRDLYNWIYEAAEKYTTENDYIISYIASPMVHMIAKRRPALDDSWIQINKLPSEYCKTAITQMKKSRRDPKIVFFFDRKPQIFPLGSLKKPKYIWCPQEISPPPSDLISKYVAEHMHLVDTFKLHDGIFVYCYYRNQ